VYALSRDDANSLDAGLEVFSCGPKGHIIIVTGNGQSWHGNGHERRAGSSAQRPILNSWKEIAAYLGRGVRTVQRWERDMGLPVHRPKGKDRSAVLALAEELDAWLRHTPIRFTARNSPVMEMPRDRSSQSA
jgi:hypothetical protein